MKTNQISNNMNEKLIELEAKLKCIKTHIDILIKIAEENKKDEEMGLYSMGWEDGKLHALNRLLIHFDE